MNSTNRQSNSQGTKLPKEISPIKFSTVLLGVTFLMFSVLLYLPATIYFSNLNEFSLRLNDLSWIFLPAWVLSVTCGVGLVLLFPRAARSRAVSLTFALGLLLWLQGSVLVWQYGPLDGSDIPWESFRWYGAIDTPIWVLVLLLAAWIPAMFVKVCRPAAIVVMAAQLVLIFLAAGTNQTTADDPSARNYAIDYASKYAFSQKQNVILFILDAYQSDIFFEILSKEPEYANYFDGFTYFRDAIAGSNYTELAIPALLTGKIFDNSQRREEFLHDAFLEFGITTKLKRNGFVVDIYPWMGWGNDSIYFDSAIASNLSKIDRRLVVEPTFTENKAKEAIHLLDLSLFRALPHFLKRYIHNNQKWLVAYVATYFLPEGLKQVVAADDQFEIGRFVNEAPRELPTNRGKRVFKYFHLKGAHSPLTVNQDLNFTSQTFPFNKENYVLQAKANLIFLNKFFEKLRRAGIYDNSLILVLGDHGSGDSPEIYIEPPHASRDPYRLEGTKRNFRRDKARAIPLVLIKRIESSGSLKVSDAPVSLTDIPATILLELGLESDVENPSMFQVDPKEMRVRYHSAFEFSPNKGGYVDDITVYRINGDSWLNDSWIVDEIRTAVHLQNQGNPD